MPRMELFSRLTELICPSGHVFVTDCFLVRPEYRELFNRHWHVRIGTMEEYRHAAWEAGLREERIEEISHRVEYFWAMTHALIQAEKRARRPTPAGDLQFDEALQAHALVRRGLLDGGYRYAL